MSSPFPTPDPAAAPPHPALQIPPTPPDGVRPDAAATPPAADAGPPADPPRERPRLQQPVRGRRLARPPDGPASPLTPQQRLLVLDSWRRSGLPAGDFAPLVGVSK